MGDTWVYHHQDLGEPVHVDGSPILRPVVPLIVGAELPAVLGVLDSGSPISVASADLFAFLGVDIEADDPLYEIPLSVGGGFRADTSLSCSPTTQLAGRPRSWCVVESRSWSAQPMAFAVCCAAGPTGLV